MNETKNRRSSWGELRRTSTRVAAGYEPSIGHVTDSARVSPDFLEQITFRAVVDALAQATQTYWLRRAEQLEAARPRPGEFHGLATPEQLNERWQRLTDDARECRRHATLFDSHDIDLDLVRNLLGWTSPDENEGAAAA